MMIQDSPITVLAGAALEPYRRLAFDGTNWTYASAAAMGKGVSGARADSGAYTELALFCTDGVFKITSDGTCAVGGIAYAAASGKVSATGYIPVGLVTEIFGSTDGDVVHVIPVPTTVDGGLLYNNTAVGTALTGSSTETDLDSFTLPANFLKAGDEIEIEGWGIATATNSTDTLAINVKLGSVTVCAVAAVDAANNNIWRFRMVITVRSVGASGKIIAHGNAGALGATSTAELMRTLNEATLDTTAAAAAKVTGTWSTTSGGNSCRSEQFAVRLRRKAA
jgi:hypothetical protein